MTLSSIKGLINVFLFLVPFCNGYSQTKSDFIGEWEFFNSDKTLKIKLEFGLDSEDNLYGNFFSVNIGRALIKESTIANSSLTFRTTLGTDFSIYGKMDQTEHDYQCKIDINGEVYELTGKKITNENNNRTNYSEPSWSPDGQFIITSVERFGKKGIKLLSRKRNKWEELWFIDNAQRAQFSNDGSKVAYVSYFSIKDELWVIELETQEKRHIGSSDFGIDLLQWSTDDQTILFSSTEGPYIVDVNSRNFSKVYEDQNPSYYCRFSSDNILILCTSTKDNIYNIVMYDSQKNETKNITNLNTPDFNQQINADGNIIWISTRDGNSEVYSTSIKDTGFVKRLTNNDYRDNNPRFSKNGQYITWVSRKEHPEIYLMNSDGSNQRNLSNSKSSDTNPIFSPNNKEIMFLSDRDGQNEIFIIVLKSENVIKVVRENLD